MNAKRISLDEKERPRLETRKLQMRKLTSKGKHTVKSRKSSTHKSDIKPSNHEKRRVRMQDIRNAFEIKRPALRTIMCVCVCVCVCVYVYRKKETERESTLYQNLMVTANQKSAIDTHRKEKLIQTKH